MKHGIAFRTLSRSTAHRMMMLRNLVSALLEHGQIKTTVAKAKETARLADKMITLGKRGTNQAKNQASSFVLNPNTTLPLLFGEYATRYSQRNGGYTRIHKYGNRLGDNAPHAIIELVDGPNDLKFAMTARAVGRETIERYLTQGEFQGIPASATNASTDAAAAVGSGTTTNHLREKTLLNLKKALQYRSPEDKARFQAQAAVWANRIIAEPSLHQGIRQTVPRDQKPSSSTSSTPKDKTKGIAILGRQVKAGERLLGVPSSTPHGTTSAINIARGRLAIKGQAPTSRFWEEGWKASLLKARPPVEVMSPRP